MILFEKRDYFCEIKSLKIANHPKIPKLLKSLKLLKNPKFPYKSLSPIRLSTFLGKFQPPEFKLIYFRLNFFIASGFCCHIRNFTAGIK